MSANLKRTALFLAAFACVIALFWWMAWAFHSLTGWTAAPLGLTVGLVIYGIGSACIIAAVCTKDESHD